MIATTGLTKHYGRADARETVLDDVSITIDDGEFVAIVGTSGSGKTTLLNIIGGLDTGWEGSVSVGGKELDDLGDQELAAMRNSTIGFVFQQFNLLDHLTSLENVLLPAFFGKGPPEGMRDRAAGLLERVGLADKIESRPPQLSGGQKQRVAIARALIQEPTLILCDEPTGSLDRDTGVQVMGIFRELNAEEELTLIMVTHEEHIAEMANRVIRLEDGRVVEDARTARQSSKASSVETA